MRLASGIHAEQPSSLPGNRLRLHIYPSGRKQRACLSASARRFSANSPSFGKAEESKNGKMVDFCRKYRYLRGK